MQIYLLRSLCFYYKSIHKKINKIWFVTCKTNLKSSIEGQEVEREKKKNVKTIDYLRHHSKVVLTTLLVLAGGPFFPLRIYAYVHIKIKCVSLWPYYSIDKNQTVCFTFFPLYIHIFTKSPQKSFIPTKSLNPYYFYSLLILLEERKRMGVSNHKLIFFFFCFVLYSCVIPKLVFGGTTRHYNFEVNR